MAKDKPIAAYGFLRLPNCVLDSPIAVGSTEWFTWLSESGSTQFGLQTSSGSLTCKLESRSGSNYWYAYKRKFNRLRKLYVGRTEDLTSSRLDQVCFEINTSDECYWDTRSRKPQPEKLPKDWVISSAGVTRPSREEMEAITSDLLKTPTFTRGGKDSGTVRRVLGAFIDRLLANETQVNAPQERAINTP